MKIIDTHAHYDDRQFDTDRYELLTQILDTNVDKIINIGCSIETSRFSAELSQKYDKIYAAVGIHPGDIDSAPDNYLEILEELCQNKKTVAIGEIGLDYHYEGFDRSRQIRFFKEQIKLANKLHKPVIIHSREATEDTMNVLKEIKPEKAVMHCYSGSTETAAELIRMGIMISFTGVLTFKNSKKAVETCRNTPLDMIMLETDSPYMAPVPMRGKRCDSSMTIYTAQKLAEIKEMSTDEVIEICNENAVRFFGLD